MRPYFIEILFSNVNVDLSLPTNSSVRVIVGVSQRLLQLLKNIQLLCF